MKPHDPGPRRFCLRPGCERTVSLRYVACKPCWMALPRSLRRAVETSYPSDPLLRTPEAATGSFSVALDDARRFWRDRARKDGKAKEAARADE